VSDKKNTDESWLERLSLKDAMAKLDPASSRFWHCGFTTEKHRWKSRRRWASLRRRSAGWKKTRLTNPKKYLKGGVAKYFANPQTILPVAKWSPAGGFYLLAIAHSTQKGPQDRPFSLFSCQVY
jgi:hypothetical protein